MKGGRLIKIWWWNFLEKLGGPKYINIKKRGPPMTITIPAGVYTMKDKKSIVMSMIMRNVKI